MAFQQQQQRKKFPGDQTTSASDLASRGHCSPSSAASEDTEVTLPAALDGVGDEAQEEEVLATALEKQDDIRFASYRTAAKLRCLQRQTYLYHIDIWNMIEAFREKGLHTLDPSARLSETKIRALLASLYDNLQKRLPPPSSFGAAGSGGGSSSSSLAAPPVSGTSSAAAAATGRNTFLQAKESLLFSFLWRALRSSPTSERLRVRTLKTALATLCSGKLMDKLRYLFSQLADADGHLVHERFVQFLRDVMKIPAAVGEYTSFAEKQSEEIIFDPDRTVTVNDFLETMMSDPGPQCLSWLLVLHRLVNSEAVFHPVTCGSCLAHGFHGLRYKSDRGNYHLCQNCFWRGKISDEHSEDVFKEYNCFKSSSGKSSFKRGLQCIPSDKRSKQRLPHFPEEPERQMDLSNMVPHAPVRSINGEFSSLPNAVGLDFGVSCSSNFDSLPPRLMAASAEEDEHNLIAQYANKLASTACEQQQQPQSSPGRRALSHSRQIVHDLERRNREIMRDISQLRKQHHRDDADPKLMTELSELRSKKDLLDDRLQELQGTRKELMTELEELMKLLYSSQKAAAAAQGQPPPMPPDLMMPQFMQSQPQRYGYPPADIGGGGGGGGGGGSSGSGGGGGVRGPGDYPSQNPNLPR